MERKTTPMHLSTISANRQGKTFAGLPDLRVAFHRSLATIPPDQLELAAPGDNCFLQRDFLEILEKYTPKDMELAYLLFSQKERPAGLVLLQIQSFRADQSLNEGNPPQATDFCFLRSFGKFLKSLVASKVEFKAMCCGNLLLTGEHGFWFDPAVVDPAKQFAVLSHGLEFAQWKLDEEGIRVEVQFLKDYFGDKMINKSSLVDRGYFDFTVQPNMIVPIDPNWEKFDDYLSAMTSKYRVRARRAFKKAGEIVKRELSLEEIGQHQSRIYRLYRHVLENAGFNLVELHPQYFFGLAEGLGDRFKMTGYWLDNQLVGFYTYIRNFDELEAHFLGYDPDVNHSHQLYLNMLYDLIRDGIWLGVRQVNFARTALEIKSSVGAQPHEMHCFLKHRNGFANKFMKPLLDYLKPEEDWQERNPFKAPPATGE